MDTVELAIQEIVPKPWEKEISYKVRVENTFFRPASASHTLTCHARVNCVKEDVRGFLHYNVRKKDIQLDHNQSLSSFDLIVRMLGEGIYDFDLQATQQGKLLDIANHQAVTEKWEMLKKQVQSMYPGHDVQELLQKVEANVYNKERFFRLLQKDAFINTYFYDLYYYYGVMQEKGHQYVQHDFFAREDIVFITRNRYRETGAGTASIEVTGKAAIQDEQAKRIQTYLQEKGLALPSINDIRGNLTGTYTLDIKTGQIKKASVTTSLTMKNGPIRTMTVNLYSYEY